MQNEESKTRWLREAKLVGVLLLAGLVLPLAVYAVGQVVFGEYGGGGLGEFYVLIFHGLVTGDAAIWFLLLSPCILWQLLRLTFHLARRDRRQGS